jgi:hypothetical protein
MILLKDKVKEKPRRGNIYHEGTQRVHEGPDFLVSFFLRAPLRYLPRLCGKILRSAFSVINPLEACCT